MGGRAVVACLVAGALLAAVACGAGAPAEKPDGGGVTTVRYMLWGSTDELGELRGMLTSTFEPANPGIHVEVLTVAGSMYQIKLATMLAGGVAPDIVNIHEAFLPTAAENQLILPLDDLVAGDPSVRLDAFIPRLVDEARYRDGKLYKLPTGGHVVVLYYNKDLFDAAGVTYPDDTWTWDDLLAAALKLTVRNEQGQTTQWGLNGDGLGWLHYVDFIWQNGGEVFDADNHLVLGRPEYIDQNVEAWQFVADLIQKHKVTRFFEESAVLPVDPFIGGQSAMQMSGSWTTNDLMRTWKELHAKGEEGKMIRWGVAPLPKQRKRATLFFAGGPVIYRDTPYAKESWQVAKFFASEAWQKAQAVRGNVPSLKSVAYSDVFLRAEGIPADVDLRVVLDAFDYARPQPSGAAVAELMEKQISTLNSNISMGRITDIRGELLKLQAAVDSACPYCSAQR